MLAYVEAIEKQGTITIDGYTSNKTIRGIIKDVARVVEEYSKVEADALRSYLSCKLDECNNLFLEPKYSDGGYYFLAEEVPCATKYNEYKDEVEYKDGYNNYFCIRIVK